MSDTPHAFTDLPILDELGDALDTAFQRDVQRGRRRRRRGRRRTLRSVAIAVILLLLLAAAAAAGTLWVLRGSPIPSPAERDVQPTMRPLAGSQHVLALRAPDPAGGPAWGMRVGRSQTGMTCTTVGQVVDSVLGIVGLDGRFRALPEGVLDSCGQEQRDAAALIGARVFDAKRHEDVRTVVNGVGGPALRSATLLTATGRQPIAVGEGGAFLVAVRGYPEDAALRVELRFASGHRQVVNLGADRGVGPDPSDAGAWKVEANVFAPYEGTCVAFFAARPSASSPTAPRACGRAVSRRNRTQRDPYYFAIRRLRPGDHGLVTEIPWSWRRFPPRTAVWGSVRRDVVSAVIVHGPDGARPVRPAVNGAFLAVYGPDVRADQVGVEIVMRDGRHLTFRTSTGLITPRRLKR